MRKIIALLTIFSFNAYAVAPTGVGGEEGALSYTNNLKAPAYTITSLGGVNSRLETGNSNLLMNPSFEHTTVSTGWTVTNATGTADVTNQVEGKKALSLAVSGAMVVSQDSTINAANISGLQGVASVKIKATGTTGLKVCPRNAGAAVTALCVNVTADNTWKHISIPFILGATSNGIGIATTATGGTVIVDDAFVGTSAPFQDVSGARLIDAVTVTGCASNWSTAATGSFSSFGTQTGCIYTSLKNICTTPGTNVPAVKCSSLAAGDYRLEYEGNLSESNTNITGFYQFSDGTNTAREQSQIYGGTSAIGTNGISQSITYSTAQTNTTLEIKGKNSGTGTLNIFGTTSNPGVIKVWYFPPASKIYSQASQDYDWTAYTPTFTGFGTVASSECWHKREGSDLLVRCPRFVVGTPTAVEARVSLPNSLVVASNVGSTYSYVGEAVRTATTTNNYSWAVLTQPSVSYLTFGAQSTSTNKYTSLVGSSLAVAGDTIGFFTVRIPIQGWQDYGVIVGSFAGLEKCANDYECTDTFSAQVSSAGVVSNEDIDWINGNCTNPSTGNYTCTFNTNLKDGTSALSSAMNCVATTSSGSTSMAIVTASSTTSESFAVKVPGTGALANDSFSIKCQKGSADYKPKTAKVASSIGVPTVPGITTQAIDTFSVSYGATATTVCSAASSACAYIDTIGSTASINKGASAGTYSLTAPKTYAKLKCQVTSASTSQSATGILGTGSALTCSSCNTLTFITGAVGTGAVDTFGNVSCIGTY